MIQTSAFINAIHILSDIDAVSIQDILPYRTQLEQAVRVLQKKLDTISNETPQLESSLQVSAWQPARYPAAVCSETPGSRTSSDPSGLPVARGSIRIEDDANPDGAHKDAVPKALDAQRLAETLQDTNRSTKVFRYLSSGCDPIPEHGCAWFEEDSRMNDIRMCRQNCSLDERFRRGLAQRSFALEFDAWEREQRRTSRVDACSQTPEAIDEKSGLISSFLSQKSIRIKNKESASRIIRHGIRLLVFEKIYGHVGISAILIFFFADFRAVRYGSLQALKDLLRKLDLWHQLAKEKSAWLETCQSRYDDRHKSWRQMQIAWLEKRDGIVSPSVPRPCPMEGDPGSDERPYIHRSTLERGNSRNGFKLRRVDSPSRDARPVLAKPRTIAAVQAPHERSIPLAISDLISPASESPRLGPHSALVDARHAATNGASDGSHCTRAVANPAREVRPGLQHENTAVIPYSRSDQGQMLPNSTHGVFHMVSSASQDMTLGMDLGTHVDAGGPLVFNQFEYGAIPPANQHETLQVDLHTPYHPDHIASAYHQSLCGTIPSARQDETLPMEICDAVDVSGALVFNQFDYCWPTPSDSQGNISGINLGTTPSASYAPAFYASYGATSAPTQSFGQSETLLMYSSHSPHHGRFTSSIC